MYKSKYKAVIFDLHYTILRPVPSRGVIYQRIFKKHGLEVELLYIPGGPTLIQALIAGELKSAASGGTSAVLAGAGRGPVKIVLSFNNVLPYEIFATPHKKGLIKEIKDLRGK